MKFSDGSKITFLTHETDVRIRTSDSVTKSVAVVYVTYEELDKLYGEIENILQSHEWDKVKAGNNEV